MSRLTASPFHKPSPYQFPRPVHPLSPPDTDSELGAPMQPASVAGSNSVMFGVDFVEQAPQLLPQLAESPAARFKRVSTLAYNKSGLREPQERSMPTSKSLVVIVPPESFSQEHGQLGHTLSSGPRNRLSHGILMPLFSTVSIFILKIIPLADVWTPDVWPTHGYCEGVQLPEYSRYMPVPPFCGEWNDSNTSNLG